MLESGRPENSRYSVRFPLVACQSVHDSEAPVACMHVPNTVRVSGLQQHNRGHRSCSSPGDVVAILKWSLLRNSIVQVFF